MKSLESTWCAWRGRLQWSQELKLISYLGYRWIGNVVKLNWVHQCSKDDRIMNAGKKRLVCEIEEDQCECDNKVVEVFNSSFRLILAAYSSAVKGWMKKDSFIGKTKHWRSSTFALSAILAQSATLCLELRTWGKSLWPWQPIVCQPGFICGADLTLLSTLCCKTRWNCLLIQVLSMSGRASERPRQKH